MPGFIDPADPTQLWIDWDAAFEEHTEAWDRMGRSEREIASRDGVVDKIGHRLLNPFDGKLRRGEESLVEAEIERRSGRAKASRERAIAAGREPVPAGEEAERARRIAEVQRLQREGRAASAVVVSTAATGRTVANMPELLITLDVEDGAGTRRVTYVHIWGRIHFSNYNVGKRVDVRVDPDDPERVELV